MTEFIYRFRPVSRLLNDDGTSGELDSQYIFFADPKQLNDPLEGYKDVFFSGDRVIWKNLIRHYVRCLINDCCSYLCSEPGHSPNKDVGVFASSSSSPAPLNKLNDKIFNRLFSEQSIKDYIHCLASDRKIRRSELISHLNLLHPHILDVTFNVFYEEKLHPEKLEYLSQNRAERLEKLRRFSSVISSNNASQDEYEKFFETSHFVNNELQLLARYQAGNTEARAAWFYILFEYPESFCKALDKLMYPAWYTACFMSSCSDSSIWGTYGGNHQDVCLKFKTETSEKRRTLELNLPTGYGSNGIIMGKVNLEFHEVSYEKSFVDIDFFRSLGFLSTPQLMDTWYMSKKGEISICADEIHNNESNWRERYWENFYHAATVKLKAWDREQESRLILTSNLNDLSSIESRKIKYDFNSLEGIIFGINTSIEHKFKLLKKIQSLCKKFNRQEFSFYQARYDNSTRTIHYHKLNSINIGLSNSGIAPD